MKKLYTSILLLLGFIVSFGQTIPFQAAGNSGNEFRIIGIGSANKGFMLRNSYTDTTEMNSDQWLKLQRGIQARSGDTIWQRSHDLTRWFRTGAGSIIADTSNSVILIGNGSSGSPLTAEVIVSTQNGNALQSNGDGLFVRNTIQDGITEPGVITWVEDYDYDVSPAVGVIGGVEYTSAWTEITLAASDPTNDRIDLVVFNAGVGSSVGTITVITGTPAADPQQPTLTDPSTQLAMAFILVTANTTAPPSPPAQDWIYINNAEWTTASSTVRIDPASTNNPYSAPLDVQGIAAQNGDNIRFTSASPPTISNFSALTLKIFSASIWFPSSRIELRWYSGGTPIGGPVYIANGAYGFTSANLSSYQIVSIPLPDFGALSGVTALLMTVRTTGSRNISFYIDDIQLQDGTVPTIGYTASNGITLAGSDFQLGGTLTKNTTITSSGFGLTISGSAANSNLTINNTHATGGGIIATTQAGTAVSGSSSTGVGVIAENSSTVVDAVTNTLQIRRSISGAPSAGIGGAIEYLISTNQSPFTPQRSNRLISSWTDEFLASRTSEFKITGVSSAVESDLFTLSGSGALKLNKYTTSAFTGTAVNTLQTDASGNIIQGPVAISGITADNGLTENVANNVQLGGTLLQSTTVETAAFLMRFRNNTSAATLTASNTSSGVALVSSSTSGTGVFATSTSGTGLQASSSSGLAGYFQVDPTSTNTAIQAMQFVRNTSATAADGIGLSLDFLIETDAGGAAKTANQLISKFTTAADLTRVSQFVLSGVDNATTADLLTISGSGSARLNKYGIGTFTGTPAYAITTDASGNLIETAISASGLVYTASNGLTMTANNTKLGGSLIENTTITASTFITSFTGANTSGTNGIIAITNSTTGNALSAINNGGSATLNIQNQGSGAGITVTSSSGFGINAASTTGLAGRIRANPPTTNTRVDVLEVIRASSGTPTAGLAGAIAFRLEDDAANETIVNRITSELTNVTTASLASKLVFYGMDAAAETTILTLNGNKSIQFNGRAQFQQGADVASVAGAIAVGLDGNVFELTGTDAITLISNLNWQNGSEITFVFTSTATLTDGTANSGTDIGMELAGNVNFVGSADDVITLSLTEVGGVQRWREKSRSVN